MNPYGSDHSTTITVDITVVKIFPVHPMHDDNVYISTITSTEKSQ